MKQKVIVLGTDLPGLLAGHAASISGHDTYFVDTPEATAPGGLDFLSRPIPLTAAEVTELTVTHKGEATLFYQKLRGGGLGRPTGLTFDHADGQLVWNPREVYEQLMSVYSRCFLEAPKTGIDETYIGTLDPFALIISSVPAPSICKNPEDPGHNFTWADTLRKAHVANPDEHSVVLSGDFSDPWCIEGSTFFGTYRVYPSRDAPPMSSDKLTREYLPLKTNCDCWPDVFKVGKAATWESGYSDHRAFYDVTHKLM